jgi:hypothetical protein
MRACRRERWYDPSRGCERASGDVEAAEPSEPAAPERLDRPDRPGPDGLLLDGRRRCGIGRPVRGLESSRGEAGVRVGEMGGTRLPLVGGQGGFASGDEHIGDAGVSAEGDLIAGRQAVSGVRGVHTGVSRERREGDRHGDDRKLSRAERMVVMGIDEQSIGDEDKRVRIVMEMEPREDEGVAVVESASGGEKE